MQEAVNNQSSAKGNPLVSVICLCHHHENFVEEALSSVFHQTYAAIEVIIVDDASTDRSVAVIEKFLSQQENSRYVVKKLFLPENTGNCRAFNKGFTLATGKYVIDFATDDIMLPQRIAQQVAFFEQLPPNYGVVFTEASYIDQNGKYLYHHYQDKLKRIRPVPTGNVYAQILGRYFISSPTMMMKKQVLEKLGGYDEQLAYEDFDFWVRSSRLYRYAYLPVCTTKVRKLPGSLSTKSYKQDDQQLHATYLICKKAIKLNQTAEEQAALVKRIKFELRQAIFSDKRTEARLFFSLLQKQAGIRGGYYLLYALFRTNIKLSWVKNLYQQWRTSGLVFIFSLCDT